MARIQTTPSYIGEIRLVFRNLFGKNTYGNAVTGENNRRLTRIKEIETRLGEITELQKHIGTYRKTREIYQQYRATGKDVDFYEQFRKDLALHEAAKKYFDEHGYGKDKKLPPMQSLKQEWATLAAEKNTRTTPCLQEM